MNLSCAPLVAILAQVCAARKPLFFPFLCADPPMFFSSLFTCCFQRDAESSEFGHVSCVDVTVGDGGDEIVLSFHSEGVLILAMSFSGVREARLWAHRTHGATNADVVFPTDCEPDSFAQASLAARVHWTVGENTWEMSQGDLLMAACEALDSKAGCATVIVARKLASRSRRVEWALVAAKEWNLAEDTDITQDSASTSIASSSQSPRSTVAESQHQYVWDVTLQTAPAQEFVAHHQVSPCRLRQEGGSRAFRWPQEVLMSPCGWRRKTPARMTLKGSHGSPPSLRQMG